MTNATKAAIISVLNAALGASVAFGAPLTELQIGAVLLLGNTLLGLLVAVTYKNSRKRIPE